MNQQISSELTIFYKFIEPLFGLLIVAVLLFGGFFPAEIPTTVKFVFIAVAIGSFIVTSIFSWPLKKVELESENLLVSDYFQDVMCPLSSIDKVEESYAFRRHRIILHLKESSQFGKRIIFVPKLNLDLSLLKSTVVEKKGEIVKKRKPLHEALKSYWFYLIGIAVFPSLLIFGTEVYKIPFDFFIIPFFVFSFLAAWPCLSGRASYAFWIAAMICFLVGGIFATLLKYILKSVAF